VTKGGSIKDIEEKFFISEEYKVMIESAKWLIERGWKLQ
jgi:hypothetical protein